MADKKKEQPIKMTREKLDETIDKVYDKGYVSGFTKGHINGLALSVAYIYEYVSDLTSLNPDSEYYNAAINFENEVDRMRRKISAERIHMDL